MALAIIVWYPANTFSFSFRYVKFPQPVKSSDVSQKTKSPYFNNELEFVFKYSLFTYLSLCLLGLISKLYLECISP